MVAFDDANFASGEAEVPGEQRNDALIGQVVFWFFAHADLKVDRGNLPYFFVFRSRFHLHLDEHNSYYPCLSVLSKDEPRSGAQTGAGFNRISCPILVA